MAITGIQLALELQSIVDGLGSGDDYEPLQKALGTGGTAYIPPSGVTATLDAVATFLDTPTGSTILTKLNELITEYNTLRTDVQALGSVTASEVDTL